MKKYLIVPFLLLCSHVHPAPWSFSAMFSAKEYDDLEKIKATDAKIASVFDIAYSILYNCNYFKGTKPANADKLEIPRQVYIVYGDLDLVLPQKGLGSILCAVTFESNSIIAVTDLAFSSTGCDDLVTLFVHELIHMTGLKHVNTSLDPNDEINKIANVCVMEAKK